MVNSCLKNLFFPPKNLEKILVSVTRMLRLFKKKLAPKIRMRHLFFWSEILLNKSHLFVCIIFQIKPDLFFLFMVLSNAKHSISINLYSTYNVLTSWLSFILFNQKMRRKIFSYIYKDFWRENLDNLHRVSPDNNLGKNFDSVRLEIFYQIFYEQHLVQFFPISNHFSFRLGEFRSKFKTCFAFFPCTRCCKHYFYNNKQHGKLYSICFA